MCRKSDWIFSDIVQRLPVAQRRFREWRLGFDAFAFEEGGLEDLDGLSVGGADVCDAMNGFLNVDLELKRKINMGDR